MRTCCAPRGLFSLGAAGTKGRPTAATALRNANCNDTWAGLTFPPALSLKVENGQVRSHIMVRAPIVLRYGVAIGAVAAALAGALLLQRFFEITPAVSLFLCGVLFAASFGGLGPGLLAIALSLLAFDYCFLPPLHSLVVRSNDVLRLTLFAVAALFVVGTAQRLRRARGELLAVVRELKGVETSLRAENADRQRRRRSFGGLSEICRQSSIRSRPMSRAIGRMAPRTS